MLRPFIGVKSRVLIFIRIFFEPFFIPIHDGLNFLHKQKFAKSRDFRNHKFVECVDRRRQNTQTVGPNRIRQLLNTDARYNFVLTGQFKETLVEHIVFVTVDEGWDVPDDS